MFVTRVLLGTKQRAGFFALKKGALIATVLGTWHVAPSGDLCELVRIGTKQRIGPGGLGLGGLRSSLTKHLSASLP